MSKLLIDTCVWIDLAKTPKNHGLLRVIEDMVEEDLVRLLVPPIVLTEFRRNRDRIEADSSRSLRTHFRLVKDAVEKMSTSPRRKKAVLTHLDEVSHKAPLLGGTAKAVLDRIEALLTAGEMCKPNTKIRLRAADRAMKRKAPFQHNKNSMADALIIETYAECLSSQPRSQRFVFVTHNTSDFSAEGGNTKRPHQDISDLFSRSRSLYFTNLGDALRRIGPSWMTNIIFEFAHQEPRGLKAIQEAEDLLHHQVWYNRHWNWRSKVLDGSIRIVEKEDFPTSGNTQHLIPRDIWEGALKSATKLEKTLGKKNLGPWDDFEWGMINGKLSALRWVLGDDWDMLDT